MLVKNASVAQNSTSITIDNTTYNLHVGSATYIKDTNCSIELSNVSFADAVPTISLNLLLHESVSSANSTATSHAPNGSELVVTAPPPPATAGIAIAVIIVFSVAIVCALVYMFTKSVDKVPIRQGRKTGKTSMKMLCLMMLWSATLKRRLRCL